MTSQTETDITTVEPHTWTDGGTKVRLLKRIDGKTRKTKNDFAWPAVGEEVECPDWNPANCCGGGLHFWPWAMGLGEGQEYDLVDDEWIVAEADPSEIVGAIDGGLKCKARAVKIVYSGDFSGAMQLIREGQHRLISAMARPATPSPSDATESGASDKNYARLASSGDSARLASSGDSARLASSGCSAQLASSGYSAQLASSGYSAQLASSGDSAQLASSGDYARLASSGDYAQLASSGDSARLASSGYYARLASSGYSAQLASSGDSAQLASSGYYAQIKTKGDNSIVACASPSSKVRMRSGAFAIAFIHPDGSPDFAVGRVGENGIKPGVWYGVSDGKIVEVEV